MYYSLINKKETYLVCSPSIHCNNCKTCWVFFNEEKINSNDDMDNSYWSKNNSILMDLKLCQ